MEIIHLGHSSFRLRGKIATVITDPFDPEFIGLKFPKLTGDIITISHQHKDHNFTDNILENPVIIAGPGEYEIKGVRIIGIATFHDDQKGEKRGKNIIYRIEIDGIAVVHLGDLGHKLDDKEIELLGEVDILLIPTGGNYTLPLKDAAEVVSKLEPRIIIPMHYSIAGLNSELTAALLPVEKFLQEMGKEGVASQPKLTVSKDKLPVEPTMIVLE